ncbi:MAG TPA: HD domain-containing phosphohydrolase [Thermoanaerobaculia bacterium]|nr:HD domain-containing phosphohydrolase [Thermoanaerobaculia bacterium]
MTTPSRSFLRRLKVRHALLLVLLLSGIIPLAVSSFLLIQKNEEVLRNAERDYLIRKAGVLSKEVSSYLVAVQRPLKELGNGLLVAPGAPLMADRLREPWVGEHLQRFVRESDGMIALRIVDGNGAGPLLAPGNLGTPARTAMDEAFQQVGKQKASDPGYRFVDMGKGAEPLAVLTIPLTAADGQRLVVMALLRFRPLEEVLRAEASPGVGIFLVDRKGQILWSDGTNQGQVELLKKSVLPEFVRQPMSLTREYEVPTGDGVQEVLVQVSAVAASGWGVVVQKPLSEAFAAVDKMIYQTVLSTLLLVALALSFAYVAASWVSRPIQRLAETTHEIAAGQFGGQIDTQGLTFEFADLAEDFNQMSGHVERYVQQLRQAAQANRELFIGNMRAFVAAIDAKDPYTRGHSERVAAYSRTIARYLQLPEEVQHKVWISGLLHDVGKIGVEDQVLRKEGKLTAEEFEQMKMHTVIGADIMTPIEQLREMVPGIRSHHEAWNGRGYPDGLKGEQIPLYGRIIGVADTFDAITTNRPYQQAFSLDYAVETIKKLTGSRFDAKIVTAFLRAFEAGDIRPRPSRSDSQIMQAKAAASG